MRPGRRFPTIQPLGRRGRLQCVAILLEIESRTMLIARVGVSCERAAALELLVSHERQSQLSLSPAGMHGGS